jgi:hypothetical protein
MKTLLLLTSDVLADRYSISKSPSRSHSLNHHLERHLHKNRFLYFFSLSNSFSISHTHSREPFSSSIFG